jgi:hypothetical protein
MEQWPTVPGTLLIGRWPVDILIRFSHCRRDNLDLQPLPHGNRTWIFVFSKL